MIKELKKEKSFEHYFNFPNIFCIIKLNIPFIYLFSVAEDPKFFEIVCRRKKTHEVGRLGRSILLFPKYCNRLMKDSRKRVYRRSH